MVVKELGGRKGVRTQDGPQPRHHIRRGKETEKEAFDRLSLLQPQTPQLLGVQILLLRIPGAAKCLGYRSLTLECWLFTAS